MPASNYENSLGQFHEAFGMARNETNPSLELLELRLKLILEESHEVRDAFGDLMVTTVYPVNNDIVKRKANLAKELADLLYVTFGAFDALGVDAQVVFNRVHKSNMSKLGSDGRPVYREDGKVLKGPNYAPPNLEDLFE